MSCHARNIDYVKCMETVFNLGGDETALQFYELFTYATGGAIFLVVAWMLGNLYDAFAAGKIGFAVMLKAFVRIIFVLVFGIYFIS